VQADAASKCGKDHFNRCVRTLSGYTRQSANAVPRKEKAMGQVTIVGGGLAGLTAAIAAAEEGAEVHLIEAHETLGGRARSSTGPYKANFGPHVIYKDGPLWGWLVERDLLPRYAGPPLAGIRFRWQGAVRRTPPLGTIPAVLRLRGREAPVDQDFRGWAASHADERTAEMLSSAAGVYTFHHDPGELSAAFVWKHSVRVLISPPPTARYLIGGWNSLIGTLEARVRRLGVKVETGRAVKSLPPAPVIVATELAQARELIGDDSLRWSGGKTVCLDLGLEHRRGDPFVVSDLDEAAWIERFSAPDSSLAPEGEELIQAQMPIRPGEGTESAALRLERLLDASLPEWRKRETWRRRQVMEARTGPLDYPGQSWRDRPAIDRGDGVFLAGDMVAAPGLLSEVSWASATEAARLALAFAGDRRAELRRVA
jgi:putative NAD(P)-binding protein